MASTPSFTASYEKVGITLPSAPIISLNLLKPGSESSIQEKFILDTGADQSCITFDIFKRLDLEYFGDAAVNVGGITGRSRWRKTAVQIETPFGFNKIVEVLINPQSDDNIVGRELLNRWKILFDGPGEQYTISVP
ncbi:MAG TPA: hypothetical protein VKA68_16800 [bacterium]|nr:hypothetical protein [bacterium]